MKQLRMAASVLLSATLVHAEDFNLKYFGDGPIALHTTLTFEGKGERIVAKAKNDSGAPILHAKICIAAAPIKKGCLFEFWNNTLWAPGEELSWNLMTQVKTPDLAHDAMIEEFEGPKRPETVSAAPANSTAPAGPASAKTAAEPQGSAAALPPPPSPAISYSVANLSHGPTIPIQDGTPIRMRLAQNLSSATAQIGDSVSFEVLDDVTVGNALLISGGAIALATVTASQEKRSMGRAGRLDVTLDYVRAVSGEKIRLRGVQDTKGGGHTGAMTGAMVATAVVFWPAAPLFLFMKGKDVTIPKGHEVTVFVDGDQHVAALAPTTAPTRSEIEANDKPAPRPMNVGKPMTNEDVLTLKDAGFGDDFIISKIKTSNAGYSLDTPDLVKLKQAGLSEAVIGAMVQAGAAK